MKSKYTNIALIVTAVLLVIGIVTLCIYGEISNRNKYKNNVTNAEEVLAPSENSNSNKNSDSGTVNKDKEENTAPQKQTNRPEDLSRSRFDGKKLQDNKASVPILMYHCIEKEIDQATGKIKPNELKVPPELFREQMSYLKDNGFTTITLQELYKFMESNEQIPEKSIVITFDDGYADNYTNAFPILKEFGFTATVFVITDYVDKNGYYLNSQQLKEMYDGGIDIEPHTVNHPKLNEKSYDIQLNELKASKDFIEKLLSKKAEFTAYPYGKYNNNTLKAAKEAGYKMGILMGGGWANKSNGLMFVRRVYISALKDMESFKDRVNHSSYTK